MASTLCQKLLTIFCQKTQNFVWFRPYDFVQISLACAKTLDFYRATVANANIGSLKSPHTLPKNVCIIC